MTPDDLIDDISHSPTSSHVTGLWAERLRSHGFEELTSAAPPNVTRGFFSRSGIIIAWRDMSSMETNGVRILGAHSDSPGLHMKPSLTRSGHSLGVLAVEMYGSPILSSWFDRDLGVAGTVTMKDGGERLFTVRRPLARLAHLAIHLDRELNDRGHVIDRHRHLAPIWSVKPDSLRTVIASQVDVAEHQIASISAQLFDTQPGTRFGHQSEFISSARLDNQVSCWAAMHSLLDVDISSPSLVVLFDHEEVGSSSSDGAAGALLERLLERISLANGQSRETFLASMERSTMLSMDNSHGVHPNHPERYDLDNAPTLGNGVAVKINVNQRYATTSRSVPLLLEAADACDATVQYFSSRNDMPCGSTIGPIVATRLGIDTVDIGVPQLAMHSVREMCHTKDVQDLLKIASSYLRR